jgi:hypothetical protein
MPFSSSSTVANTPTLSYFLFISYRCHHSHAITILIITRIITPLFRLESSVSARSRYVIWACSTLVGHHVFCLNPFLCSYRACGGGLTVFFLSFIRVIAFQPLSRNPLHLVMLTVIHLMPRRCRQRGESSFFTCVLLSCLWGWIDSLFSVFHTGDCLSAAVQESFAPGYAHCHSSDASQVQAKWGVIFNCVTLFWNVITLLAFDYFLVR